MPDPGRGAKRGKARLRRLIAVLGADRSADELRAGSARPTGGAAKQIRLFVVKVDLGSTHGACIHRVMYVAYLTWSEGVSAWQLFDGRALAGEAAALPK
jgi:hypothetical protein